MHREKRLIFGNKSSGETIQTHWALGLTALHRKCLRTFKFYYRLRHISNVVAHKAYVIFDIIYEVSSKV